MQHAPARELLHFIKNSPTCYHVTENIRQKLLANGYTELSERERWEVAPGGKYFVCRNGSSTIAFRVPEMIGGGFAMAAAHSDSPAFRLKEHPDRRSAHYVQLSTEKYGGMLMSTWFDRPLSVAGRVFVRANGEIVEKLVSVDRDLLVIPSLAIHFQRDVNKGKVFNPQIDMQPLWGPAGSRTLTDLVCEELGITAEEILDWDLQLVTRQAPVQIGPDNEYFMAPRIDDLECAATTLLAFLDASGEADSACAPVWAMFDNEEVGSSSRMGAESSFLRDVLDRILDAVPHSGQAAARAMANSFMLSADNAHATHPNFPQKADPCAPVRMGGGVVLKYNASQKYTTNAVSGAVFRAVCEKAGVPVQVFTNRADEPGGSTLGNLQSHTLPIPMADIGCAQLAMHSAVETASVADAEAMIKAVAAFYRVHLRALGDGTYTLE